MDISDSSTDSLGSSKPNKEDVLSDSNYSSSNTVEDENTNIHFDDILDATHPWNSDAIKSSYRAFRACMKNKEVNADFEHKPRYLAPRENYEGMILFSMFSL